MSDGYDGIEDWLAVFGQPVEPAPASLETSGLVLVLVVVALFVLVE